MHKDFLSRKKLDNSTKWLCPKWGEYGMKIQTWHEETASRSISLDGWGARTSLQEHLD